jgi:hypothetical protein
MKLATISRWALPGGYTIETRGDSTWALVDQYHVMAVDGSWMYEPLPSSRSEEFIAATRYTSPEEAYAQWERFVQKTVT